MRGNMPHRARGRWMVVGMFKRIQGGAEQGEQAHLYIPALAWWYLHIPKTWSATKVFISVIYKSTDWPFSFNHSISPPETWVTRSEFLPLLSLRWLAESEAASEPPAHRLTKGLGPRRAQSTSAEFGYYSEPSTTWQLTQFRLWETMCHELLLEDQAYPAFLWSIHQSDTFLSSETFPKGSDSQLWSHHSLPQSIHPPLSFPPPCKKNPKTTNPLWCCSPLHQQPWIEQVVISSWRTTGNPTVRNICQAMTNCKITNKQMGGNVHIKKFFSWHIVNKLQFFLPQGRDLSSWMIWCLEMSFLFH